MSSQQKPCGAVRGWPECAEWMRWASDLLRPSAAAESWPAEPRQCRPLCKTNPGFLIYYLAPTLSTRFPQVHWMTRVALNWERYEYDKLSQVGYYRMKTVCWCHAGDNEDSLLILTEPWDELGWWNRGQWMCDPLRFTVDRLPHVGGYGISWDMYAIWPRRLQCSLAGRFHNCGVDFISDLLAVLMCFSVIIIPLNDK